MQTKSKGGLQRLYKESFGFLIGLFHGLKIHGTSVRLCVAIAIIFGSGLVLFPMFGVSS